MSEDITPNEIPDDELNVEPTADKEPTADELLPTDGFDPQIIVDMTDDTVRHRLRGMFQSWFLDYASYVILERAVPHIDDGLKPVQRRILHSMKILDDGHFNKVANIVGHTMQFHPHGDASIYEALVQLGQKDLLVETQGNWGNVLTGASAAAGRYIEARLSPFALDVIYNAKVTEWTPSYDGRAKEPVVFPVKFPLLLTQGVEGIAVGLSSKILPHNFNEIIDGAIAYLKGEDFTLYPDFITGGSIDVSRYNDGERGGAVKIRAKIEKLDNKTLAITEIPYGKTTATVIESILKAFESGKIKIRKVEDMTTDHAYILVHLLPGTSSDRTIDALYAFSDCEVSISPNCCVISDNKPHFIGVSDVLRHNVDNTREILRKELTIQLDEVNLQLHYLSLERIFIEKRIYKDKGYEESENREQAIEHIRGRLEKYAKNLLRPISDDDIIRLFDIKMGRILKFNAAKCDEQIAALNARADELKAHLATLTEYTIRWFETLKEKYGHAFPRRTQIRSFDSIQAATVAEANEKLYINREEGFIGTGLKKDEFLCNCSSIDDVIIFYKDGRYKIVKVAEKLSVGKNVLYVNVFKPKDNRTIYNVIYQKGRGGTYYMKRFSVTGITRDKEYNIIPGDVVAGQRVAWFTANPNGEAEIVKVTLKPKLRLKTLQFDVDFSGIAVKGRGAMGNIVTRNEVHRFSLKEKGGSTLGGRNVWFDQDVNRLNYDGRGRLLGEFNSGDLILVILNNGEFFTTSFEASNHYPENILRIEKFDPNKIWTAVLNDADQGYPYLKRFKFEPVNRPQRYLGENEKSTLILLTDEPGARLEVTFGGGDSFREKMEIVAHEFIAVKSYKAKGKRLTMYTLGEVTELEPVEMEAEPDEADDNEPVDVEPIEPERSDDEVRDEITGQQRLFD
ncbi:MAG: DNA gyrase/topoisomerase IV subunit A [Lachnoclostridium sp.]|nr:DNA gyrase/topoisomerase IV subunit A [Lachnoclostridium sp.]